MTVLIIINCQYIQPKIYNVAVKNLNKTPKMCEHPHDSPANPERMQQLQTLKGLAKALHGPARWAIVDIIGTDTATTDTIRAELDNRGYDLTRSGVYYHLSELSDAGIIEVAGYLEEGRGAPTKEWELRRETIEINLVHPEE